MPKDPNDNLLVKQLKSGSEEAWNILFNKYNEILSYKAFRILGDADDAMDVVQDLFISLWTRRDVLEICEEQLTAYLFTAIKNRCIDKIEANRIQKKRTDQLEYLYSVMNHNADNEDNLKELKLEALTTELKGLSTDPCYTAFKEMHLEQKSSKDVGQQLNLLPGTVRKRAHKIVTILRNRLNPQKNN